MTFRRSDLPVLIDSGPADWQVIQQDSRGKGSIALRGSWTTIMRRKKPEVLVRVVREGSFIAISKQHDWTRAKTSVDRSVEGPKAGRCGSWSLTIKDLPCGGPYRIETTIGSAEDAVEWRRVGQAIHFLCVGDIWLIAGQSNAEGYGRDPIDDPSEIGVHQLTADGWELAAHTLRHHPWLMFAKKLKQELGCPIGLIPTAVGGSSVSQWDPGQNGVLFANMKRRLTGTENRIKGCLWYQGESDTGEKDHPHYKVRFGRFLGGLRKIVRDPLLPAITVQLNRVLGPRPDGEGWEAMREIQRQLSHELRNVFVFSIFDAGLCDGIHISSIGNVLIAERAAATALGGVYGRPVDYRHPECVSAKKVGPNAVDLKFANVVGRLDYECDLANGFPFSIRDAEGEVEAVGYKMRKRDTMRIELGRAISGKATVTGAPGACPSSVVPKDISGYRGMLAFTSRIE